MHLDIDVACVVLQRLQEEMGFSPGQEPLRTASLALHFIWGSGHLHNLEDYLACFNPDASPASFPSFGTREQAEAWLQQPMDPRHEHGAAIAGTRYSVGYSPERGVRFLLRVPENIEAIATRQTTIPLVDEALAALDQARAHVRSREDMESIHFALLALHFILDVFACVRCGGRRQVLAYLTAPIPGQAARRGAPLQLEVDELVRRRHALAARYQSARTAPPPGRPPDAQQVYSGNFRSSRADNSFACRSTNLA
ncbi:hypothetical protein DAT35_26095 [Vitiosangium sp. GDMCC 1.1324]|nr:hypothetical protein DAT35_26095 [Vitiosangium sp. GDMCC 1.1324]